MTANYWWIIGSGFLLMLGIIHLLYTFFTNKFSSRNNVVIHEMKISFPVLTKKTTIWRAWVGFNASHSIGVIFIAVINIFIALQHPIILHTSLFYLLFNLAVAIFYLWLAHKYWFTIPFAGILLANCCYLIAALLILTK